MEPHILDYLEKGLYLNNNFNKTDDVKGRIEEFSSWFNSTARLYLLRCPPEDNESYIHLLLNLKKTIKFAISEINRSIRSKKLMYTCKVCGEMVEVDGFPNHPHFEEIYECNNESVENEETSTTNGSIDDLVISEEINIVELPQTELQGPLNPNLNSFKFNFDVTYEQKIEEILYPDFLMSVARNVDRVKHYTIQMYGSRQGQCLICPCNLICQGRQTKITPFLVKNHALGQRHLKNASLASHKSALKQYHEFWRQQDPNIQAHQLHFLPEVTEIDKFYCHLCQESIGLSDILKHIKHSRHQKGILRLCQAPDSGHKVLLLDMQLEVYGLVMEDVKKVVIKDNGIRKPNVVKKEKLRKFENMKEKQAPPKKDSTPPKKENECVIITPVEPEPNSITLPYRYRDHVNFFKMCDDKVRCTLCKIVFPNDMFGIKKHICDPDHMRSSGLKMLKYSFFCEICKITLNDEISWEDHFLKGPNRHDSLSQGRKIKTAEYECTSCMLVIYGDETSVNRHIARGGKIARVRETKLPFPVKKHFKSKILIENAAKILQMEANNIVEKQERMLECLDNLNSAVAHIYPNCKAYAFGSRLSGLGHNDSDLDVFMDLGGMYLGEKDQDPDDQEHFVKKVGKYLKSNDDFSNVLLIPSARTPIVKLTHNYTNLDCDISFRHGLGVENTKFLRFCIALQPITQPFILMLKRWSDFCRLNDHITNYTLALMAVFFLQTCGYLPSVKTVRIHNPTKPIVIDGWETINYTVPTEQMKEFVQPITTDLTQLLRDFFYYYSKFDYANQVVCPLLGTTVAKFAFNEKPSENLPIEMQSYVHRRKNANGERFRGLSPFCVQDPFDLSHNLTKACNHGTITKLKTYCTLTYELLDSVEEEPSA